jgi:hypothetical protein
MDYDLNQTCELHESRYDCPDALVNVVRGGYGLIVHDGGSSVIGDRVLSVVWIKASKDR